MNTSPNPRELTRMAQHATFEATQARRSGHALAVGATALIVVAGMAWAADVTLAFLVLSLIAVLLIIGALGEWDDADDWSAQASTLQAALKELVNP